MSVPSTLRKRLKDVARPAPTLAEVFAPHPGEAAAVGFVLARLAGDEGKPLLWLQDRLSARETGQPYRIAHPGGVIRLDLSHPRDVLIAAEEGLRCAALAGVVAEIWGDPPALDFTATKRLALRAEAARLPCWLVRHGGTANLSAARERWRVVSLPSAADPDDPRAPGAPRWRAELFRARDGRPGTWVVHHDRAADRVDLLADLPDSALAADGRAPRFGTAG